jgi:hypothetical protein
MYEVAPQPEHLKASHRKPPTLPWRDTLDAAPLLLQHAVVLVFAGVCRPALHELGLRLDAV